MRFTDSLARSLPLPAGKTDAIVFDERRPGLGVRVRANAKRDWLTRTWVVQCRVAGRSQRHDLGPVDATPTKRARELADEIFAKVRQGIDPKAEKRDARDKAAETFELLGQQFLEHVKKRRRAGGSYSEVERHIEEKFKPLNGEAIHSIDRKKIAANLTRIAGESGDVSANRARATLSSFFAWAMGEGLIDANPVVGTTRREEKPRERTLSPGELVAVWSACGDDDYGRIVRLLILTGQRRDEVGGMAEGEVQRDLRMWSMPSERTKNGLPHDVPLSDAARDLLPVARDGRDLLFGRGEGAFSGWSRCKARLDERIKKASKDGKGLAPWTLHDLRRTTATLMGDEIGVQPHIVEAVLNHISGARRGVAGIYNRALYAAEKRKALEDWAVHVDKLVTGAASNVVALRTSNV